MSIIHAEQIENCDLVYFSFIFFFFRFFRVCALRKDKPNDSTNFINGFYFIKTLEMQYEMRILFLTDVNSKAQNLSDLHLLEVFRTSFRERWKVLNEKVLTFPH